MTAPRRRLAELMFAGLVDSLCLSFAWTVLMLQVVSEYGLASAGLLSAAMLVGVALSAPVASRLAQWLDGRQLLRTAAAIESLLRIGVFALLIGNAPLTVLAVCVTAMNVTAWTGYAGMRAEVAAAHPAGSALTWYGTGVASIEAVGAAGAALLPFFADVQSESVLAGVAVVYVLGLLPTAVVARRSPIVRASRPARSPLARQVRPRMSLPVIAGVVLMFAASAPTLLSVGLAAELHGRSSVALVAIAFTVGSLAAPALAWHVQRRRVNGLPVWILCAVGMVAGWVLAPVSISLMIVAQALSGLCMTSLEGLLDTSAAARAGMGVTGALARATAGRALGSAAAAAMLPGAVTAVGLGPTAAVISVLLMITLLVVRSTVSPAKTRSPVPDVGRRPPYSEVLEAGK